jgi:hypothetical protein
MEWMAAWTMSANSAPLWPGCGSRSRRTIMALITHATLTAVPVTGSDLRECFMTEGSIRRGEERRPVVGPNHRQCLSVTVVRRL